MFYFPPFIGSWVFQDCTNLTAVAIGDGVEHIPPYAFSNCVSLKTVLLPNSLVRIANGAFENCRCLSGLTIPNSVTRLGAFAFAGCTSLTSITIPGSVTQWDAIVIGPVPTPGPPIPALVMGWTFRGCTNLRTVVIENGVSMLPAGAFAGCSRLTCITIPRSFTSLGFAPSEWTNEWPIFEGCTNLTRIYFEGNSPILLSDELPQNATVYYLPSTTGWATTYGACPTALWQPRVETCDAGFGVQGGQFGFNINWGSGRHVVVEVCSDLSTGFWVPLATNTLLSGTAYFSDPDGAKHPARIYRLRWP